MTLAERLPTSPLPPRHHRVRGFTLIELLVGVGILALLMRLAAPSFQSTYLSNRLATYANNFVASVQLARSEAIKRNAAVTLCRSADGTSCASSGGWEQGWIVLAGSTVVQYQQALNVEYHFTGSAYSLSFDPSGLGATSTTLTLCRATPTPGNQERSVQIYSTGRVAITTTKTGTCT